MITKEKKEGKKGGEKNGKNKDLGKQSGGGGRKKRSKG